MLPQLLLLYRTGAGKTGCCGVVGVHDCPRLLWMPHAHSKAVPDGALNYRLSFPGLIRSGNLSRLSVQGRAHLMSSHVSRIVTVLGAILDVPPVPVLVHCHAGKDRTGLTLALCAELVELPRNQIDADYRAIRPELNGFYADQRRLTEPAKCGSLGQIRSV
ncbi:tyrosine-protein phosphatase [Deinococcus oregonensis]|uniref:Tyrosine-protein phosphatase n=1 Tax=Deinococcus oregonensis TaxID=1805970 RepID=A0ABV6B5X2_9DEIO